MVDLGLNQYKIKEIKYEVKEGKTVIFKFRNYNIIDVDIVEEYKNNDSEKNEQEYKPKEIHDYKPISCLEKEIGMQKSLEASRTKEWKDCMEKKPIDTTSLVDDTLSDTVKAEPCDKIYSEASSDEISDFIKREKNLDFKRELEIKLRNKNALDKSLNEAKTLISEYYNMPYDSINLADWAKKTKQ